MPQQSQHDNDVNIRFHSPGGDENWSTNEARDLAREVDPIINSLTDPNHKQKLRRFYQCSEAMRSYIQQQVGRETTQSSGGGTQQHRGS